MERFIYKGECGVHASTSLTEELAWAIDKLLCISYYTIPLETCKEAIG